MEGLPRDVLCEWIARHLCMRDIVSLSSCNRTLRSALYHTPQCDVQLCLALLNNPRDSLSMMVQWCLHRPAFARWAVRRTPSSNHFQVMACVAGPVMEARVVEMLATLAVEEGWTASVRLEQWLVTAAHSNGAALARTLVKRYGAQLKGKQTPAAYAAAMRDSLEVLRELDGVEARDWPRILCHAFRYDSRRVLTYLVREKRVSPEYAVKYKHVTEEGRQFLESLLH